MQGIHKILVRYGHWANILDDRDYRVAGLREKILIANDNIWVGNYFDNLPEDVIHDIGFITYFYGNTSADTANVRWIINGIERSNQQMIHTGIPIFSQHLDIHILNNHTGNVSMYYHFLYIPIDVYVHYSEGQDSISDSGGSAGIDFPEKKTVKDV